MNKTLHQDSYQTLLQHIVESIPIRVFWKDRDSRYLGCNTLFARDAGLNRPDDLIGKTDFEMGWKAQAELYRADDRRVMESGVPILGYVEPQTTLRGDTIWLRTSKVPLRDTAQQVIGVLGIYEDITEKKKSEAALKESEEMLAEAQRISHIGSWKLDLLTNTLTWSTEIYRIFEKDPESFGTSYEAFLQAIHPDDREKVALAYAESVKNRQPYSIEHRLLTEDGRIKYIHETCETTYDQNGKPLFSIGTVRDITDAKNAEQNQKRLTRALRLLSDCNATLVHAEEEHKLLSDICRLAVETGGYLMAWVGFADQDAAKTVRPVAQSGYEQGYLDSVNITWADTDRGQGPTGSAIRTGVTVVSHDCLTDPNMAPWREAAITRGYQSSIALPLVGKRRVLGTLTIYSQERFAFNAEEVSLLEELANDLAYGIETLRTRVEHEEAEKKLEFLAHHDALTRLPNRLLLRDRFDQAVAIANREQSTLGFFFLDLDNFKQINDSLGHNYGDQLLIRVVERLQGCIRETDTISRQGGDEFVILLANVREPGIIEAVAQNIIGAFGEPFKIDGYTLTTSFSIGISLFPNDGREFDVLLKQADAALYSAKEAGRNTYRFFSERMNIDTLENISLQGQLHSALKNLEFLLHYQPQIDMTSGQIIGAEALVRWQHPEMGFIAPDRFIPLAERSGLIIPIGEWVLTEACRQAQIWRETCQLQGMVVAVNLSALQFRRSDVVETVTAALDRSGLPPSNLELELTESILLHDLEVVMGTLHRLKEIGVKVSIDDFGTGYSSLSYLKRLAVDKLKIDQSFVRDMVEDAESAAIVRAIIQLGHVLQLMIIAEGVENDSQLALLKKYGCEQFQGYLFSRPVPAEEFTGLCKRRSRERGH
jgi:diguanylate cyclase (GGDEF)-like protein/PAS domain S-box-containing protein